MSQLSYKGSNILNIDADFFSADVTNTFKSTSISGSSSAPVEPGLYTFTTATFTSGGQNGNTGPILSQARSGVSGTPSPSTWTSTYLNMSTQGIQLWTVPSTATYTIRVMGGSGGGANNGGLTSGGRGVILQANFNLTKGQVIKILVGQGGATGGQPSNCDPAGGGGTFVVDELNNPIIVAGGGGGGSTATFAGSIPGQDGITTRNGGTGPGSGGSGGTNGSGGSQGYAMASAGFSGNGQLPTWNSGVGFTSPSSFLNGGLGGTSTNATWNRNGGFGGGAAAHGNCCIGAGAGGGYSGGGGGGSQCFNGAGGGSFISSSAISGSVQTSDGSYDGSFTFGGSAITNINSYNTAGGCCDTYGANGSVIITKI
jgi:hypothetical protein